MLFSSGPPSIQSCIEWIERFDCGKVCSSNLELSIMEDLRGHGAYSLLPGTMQTNKEFPSTEYSEIFQQCGKLGIQAPMQKKEDTFHSPSGAGPCHSHCIDCWGELSIKAALRVLQAVTAHINLTTDHLIDDERLACTSADHAFHWQGQKSALISSLVSCSRIINNNTQRTLTAFEKMCSYYALVVMIQAEINFSFIWMSLKHFKELKVLPRGAWPIKLHWWLEAYQSFNFIQIFKDFAEYLDSLVAFLFLRKWKVTS